MTNPLVNHLRDGARTGGKGILARVMRPATPEYWRSFLSRLKQRPVARFFLGTTVAFACGIGLGVGVATVIAPEAATIRGMIVERTGDAGRVKGGQGTTADPVVAVRLREEGSNAISGAAETDGEPIASIAAGAAKAFVASPAGPVSAPAATEKQEPAPDTVVVPEGGAAPATAEAHVKVPIGDVVAPRHTASVDAADLPAPQTPASSPAETPPAADAGDATSEPAPPLPEHAFQSTGSGVPTNESARAVVDAGNPAGVPPFGVSGEHVALGPSGLAGAAPSPAASGEETTASSPVELPPRPVPKNLQLAALPMPRTDAWIRNAVALPDKTRDVMIAIIIDDMGIDQKRSRAAIDLPAPLTLSFIPYGYHLPELVAASRAAGHEVMLHVPMEPLDAEADPGPNALRTTVPVEENRRRLLWAFSRLEGIVGLNNHMGSKFTTWRAGMEMVMQEVQERGMLFVDSFTNNESVGFLVARERKLPSVARDVFIDHDISRGAISKSLQELERIARRRGYAVGIAHPHDLTREALHSWIIEAQARGVDFVPVSHIVRRGMKSGAG